MIDQIKGTITEIAQNNLSIIVNDMIGFAVAVPDTSLYSINQSVNLYIHLHWNQEQGPTLYGLATRQDRHVFQLIISCSGIGPKIGLAILHTMSAQNFLSALVTDNSQALSNVPGIGKKKAETIILYLKDKATALFDAGIVDVNETPTMQHLHEVSQTLSSLHYTKQEISAALDHVKKQEDCSSLAFDALLRKTLLFLSKRL